MSIVRWWITRTSKLCETQIFMSRQVGKFWWTFFGGKFLISLKTNSYSWLNFQILCIFCIFSNSLLNLQTSSLGRLLRHNQTISRLSLQWNCIGLDQVMDGRRSSLHAKSKGLHDQDSFVNSNMLFVFPGVQYKTYLSQRT